MTRQRRTHLTGVLTHNAMPHAANCATTLAENPSVTLPVDPYFENYPIRAVDSKELAGSIVVTGSAPIELPVYKVSIEGLADEARIRRYIDHLRQTDSEHDHIGLVSQIGLTALREAEIETHFTADNRIGFGVTANIQRNLRTGEIQHAARIDQPEYHPLDEWDTNEVHTRRQHILNSTGLHMVNNMPTDVRLGNGISMRRSIILQPDYSTDLIGFTYEGIPITTPRLNGIGYTADSAEGRILHPRMVHAARRLGFTSLVAQSFMPLMARDDQGNHTNQVEGLAFYHNSTLDRIAAHVT